MSRDECRLVLDGVVKTYPGAGAAPGVTVLRGVSLEVEAGESLAVTGPSGCGKSTLLNVMGGLDRPTAGCVVLGGRDLGKLPDRELAALRNRTVGFVFQLHHLLPQCTVLENILVPTLPTGRRDGATEQRAAELADRVGLGARLDHRPGQLSGGERMRCAVARALINRPQVLLADEPTGSLDRAAAERLVDLLLELNRNEGTTLIVVSHAAAVAERMARTCRLEDGLLEEASTG